MIQFLFSDDFFNTFASSYLKCPNNNERNEINTDSKTNWIGCESLIQQLSKHITRITVTTSVCNAVSGNLKMFYILLMHVSELTISLNSGSQETIQGLLNVIYFTRLFKLKAVKFKSSFGRFPLENCSTIWKALYGKLEHNTEVDKLISDLNLKTDRKQSSQANYNTNLDSSYNIYEDLVDSPTFEINTLKGNTTTETEVTSPKKRQRLSEHEIVNNQQQQSTHIEVTSPKKRQRLSEHEVVNHQQQQSRNIEDDLFNFALEPFEETVDVNTRIDSLDISLSGADTYNSAFIPALKNWTSLKSLCLCRTVIDRSDFRIIFQSLKCSLRELKLSDFDCSTHHDALLQLELEKLSLLYCETPDHFYRTLLGEDINTRSIVSLNTPYRDTTRNIDFIKDNADADSSYNENNSKLNAAVLHNVADKQKLEVSKNILLQESTHNFSTSALHKLEATGENVEVSKNNLLQDSTHNFNTSALHILEVTGENVLTNDLCQGLQQNRTLQALNLCCTFDFNEFYLAQLWTIVSGQWDYIIIFRCSFSLYKSWGKDFFLQN